MADVRPFQGLHYQSATVGDLGDVIAPPYDVISDEAQRHLYDRSPYNIVRIEFRLDDRPGEDSYRSAAETLAAWRQAGILAVDAHPSFYLYEQQFEHDGQEYRRRSIIGRVRLEPWDRGVVLPHEHTLSGPKEDRLRLLRACRTNVSPVFGLYRPDGGAAVQTCGPATATVPVADAVDSNGQRHRVWRVDDPAAIQALTAQFSGRTLYIADGHHRYETALAYRDERAAATPAWSGEEPENFVLMALTAADDPGLLILPIHRLVSPEPGRATGLDGLSATFVVEPLPAAPDRTAAVRNLLGRMHAAPNPTAVIGCLRQGRELLLLTLRGPDDLAARMPAGHSNAWSALGVNALQYGVLEPCFGIDLETVRSGEQVRFTESADEALAEVDGGRATIAFLLNATRPEEIFAVADAGDRMPQKSTYFYPKLGTGLVLYGLDAGVPSVPPAG